MSRSLSHRAIRLTYFVGAHLRCALRCYGGPVVRPISDRAGKARAGSLWRACAPAWQGSASTLRHRIGCRVRRKRSRWSSHGQFLRNLARQFLRPRRFSRFTHRHWHLRAWVARRIFLRWFCRSARCRRRDFRRFDRHLQRDLAVIAKIRRFAGDRGRCHLYVADGGAR
jgi:hypothetical protein